MLSPYTTHLKQQPALADLPFDRLSNVIQEAVKWGLLSPDPEIPSFLHLQPVLPYFLRNRSSSEDQQPQRIAVEKAFLDFYRELSQQLYTLITLKEADKKQFGLLLTHFEYENLLTELRFALREKASVIDPYGLLNEYLNFQQDHERGQEIDRQVVQFFETLSEEDLSGSLGKEFIFVLGATANRQLELKQYELAMKSYQKVLQMLEKVEVKLRQVLQANTYQQLGTVAQEQQKWQDAEVYYQQALQIKIECNKRYGQASTYHNLGIVAQEQRKWQDAEAYYQQALQIYVEYNDRYWQARTYHNLGIVAQRQQKWQNAEDYYQQALHIKIEYNDRYGQTSTYHQLGRLAQEQRKWQDAEDYYQQALHIKIEYNDRYGQASTYHQLGGLAQEQCKLQDAEAYYQQALQIYIEYNDRYKQGHTYHNLGVVAQEQCKLQEAEAYYQQALQIFIEYNDSYSQAHTYRGLGIVAREQGKWLEAQELFIQSLSIWQQYDDIHNSSIALNSLARLWQASHDASIVERVASLLKMSQEEAEKLLQDFISGA
jgi:tetratricopeptide (TPR) repeat protein